MGARQAGYLRVPGDEDSPYEQEQNGPRRSRSASSGRRGRKALPNEKPLPALPPSTPADAIFPISLDDDSHHVSPSERSYRRATVTIGLALIVTILGFLVAFVVLGFGLDGNGLRRGPGGNLKGAGGDECPCRPDPDVPQYFRTSPELWAGPTATGKPAFLAQTRLLPTGSFVPNAPLQTDVPIEGMEGGNESIFNMMGYLTPYQPSPGFGVEEYTLPEGADIVQVQMLSRHGSRYPTLGSNVFDFGQKVAKAHKTLKAKGALGFLNSWKYQLGHEILVPKGRQELFDSGVLHSYMYSSLYSPNSKIIVRTTTQDRMLKSAEYWLAGFFGLEWTRNATIEVIIEQDRANNSLAGYLNCPNARKQKGGDEAAKIWVSNYLTNATARIKDLVEGFDWTIEDTYAAQTMCPYETVAYGFSRFCDLFTYEEWIGFSYSVDLAFAGNNAFQNPTGRAVGIGYQQEVIARLQNHTLGYSGSQINVTLDNNTETFPLNQSLYFDFSHDTNIASILTAFGFKQFAQLLQPTEYPGQHNLTVSHITPFGARLDIEIIKTPKPFKADRSGYESEGGETKYIHFVLNQRTLPLGWSFPECDAERRDGWCELGTFLKVQEEMPKLADYERACHGDIETVPYGVVYDGRPIFTAAPLSSIPAVPAAPSWDCFGSREISPAAGTASNYDIVGFDPRGVGLSEPRPNCSAGSLPDAVDARDAAVPRLDDAYHQRYVDWGQKLEQKCLEQAGGDEGAGPHMTTAVVTARAHRAVGGSRSSWERGVKSSRFVDAPGGPIRGQEVFEGGRTEGIRRRRVLFASDIFDPTTPIEKCIPGPQVAEGRALADLWICSTIANAPKFKDAKRLTVEGMGVEF